MNGDVVALVLGTALAIGALAYVLQPLFFPSSPPRAVARDMKVAGEPAVATLREIEFDRATGKLSEADYTDLRQEYTARALREMRGAGPAGESTIDAIEARIRAWRAERRECRACGLRPEADAEYCSSCGGFLERSCPDCGTTIPQPGAQFCFTCGGRLARRAGSRA